MLEVIGAGNPDYKGKDWGDVWAQSPQCKQLAEEIDKIISSRRNREIRKNKDEHREYAMPIWTQIVTVTKRAFVAYWRSPQYTLVSVQFRHRGVEANSNRANSSFISSLDSLTRLHSGIWEIATSICNRGSSRSS